MTENKKWLLEQLPMLDTPEALIPEMNEYVRDWDIEPWTSATKFCFVAPTPYPMMIANMGIAILYDELNSDSCPTICERFYYPESKLNNRLLKESKVFFSKETGHGLAEFDVLGISSYFPQQMLLVPELLARSGLEVLTKDRKDDAPFVIFGGCTAFAAEPVTDFVDLIFVGQAEGHLRRILGIVKEEKRRSSAGWKLRVKKRICTLPGCYVPEFYAQEYYSPKAKNHKNQVKRTIPITDPAPETIVKATVALDKTPVLTKTIVSNSDGLEMACGAQLVATGCSNKCFFCAGSWTSAPYRERDTEVIKAGFDKIVEDTGAHTLVPFSFNLSDLSEINSLIGHLCTNKFRTIGMSSQRIDYFDSDFAKVSRLSGHRSITFAIEGGSERMRAVINKNLTEPQILAAFERAFTHGFTSIKIYMISYLPFETPEDRFEIVNLMEKILALKEKHQAKTKIRLSYTPFQSKNHCPFQWTTPYHVYTKKDVGSLKVIRTSREKGEETAPVTEEDVGMPVIDRNLNPVIDRLQPLGLRVRTSADLESAIVNQTLCVADRRMGKVIYDAWKEKTFGYKGGMTVGKHVLVEFRKLLVRHGIDFNYLFRDKDDDEVFPWDHIDTGISKRYLLDAWKLSQWQARERKPNGEFVHGVPKTENPFDKHFVADDPDFGGKRIMRGIPPCWTACTKCGVCGREDISPINIPHHETDLTTKELFVQLDHWHKHFPRPKEHMFIMFRVFDDFRYIHNSKKRMHLRRALSRAQVPLFKELPVASDANLVQNWVSGVDVVEVPLHKKYTYDLSALRDELNKNLWNMEVLMIKKLDTPSAQLRFRTNCMLSYIDIPDSAKLNCQKAIEEFNSAESFKVKYRAKGDTRDGIVIVARDVKQPVSAPAHIDVDTGKPVKKQKYWDFWTSVWSYPIEGGNRVLLYSNYVIGPYDFLTRLFVSRRRTFFKFPARKINYFMSRIAREVSMFDLCCEECGNPIEKDMFENYCSETRCVRHTDFSGGPGSSPYVRMLMAPKISGIQYQIPI